MIGRREVLMLLGGAADRALRTHNSSPPWSGLRCDWPAWPTHEPDAD